MYDFCSKTHSNINKQTAANVFYLGKEKSAVLRSQKLPADALLRAMSGSFDRKIPQNDKLCNCWPCKWLLF